MLRCSRGRIVILLSPLLLQVPIVPGAIFGLNKGYEYLRFAFDRRSTHVDLAEVRAC
jgi:hypothetical protein